MKRRNVALMGAVLSSTMLLSACGGGLLGSEDEGGGDTDAPIVLGMVAPTSGSSSNIGPYMQNGAQLAIDEINADGGVLGRQLELQVEDEACDAQTAVAAANKLVSDGITVSVGGYCSGATLPTLPIFERADIPMIIPAANSDELVEQELPNVFLINGTGSQQADAATTWIGEQAATRVALVHDNTSYSVNIAESTRDRLEEEGSAEVVAFDAVTPGESDLSASVNAIIGETPDFVYFTGYYQEAGLLIRQLKQAGYEGTMMIADGAVDGALIEIAGGEQAEGVFATMTQTPDTIEGAEDWIANYTEAFESEPGSYSTQSYDAVRVAAQAIEDADSTEGADIVAALEAIDGLELFSGPLKFTEQHTLTAGGFVILQVEAGEFALADALG